MTFSPARWLPGPHFQTIWSSLGRRPVRLDSVMERLELADGDFVDVERFAGPSPDAPVLVACHGLEGSSRAVYVRGLVREALSRGLAAAALNFRGCSGEPNRLPRFYHSGDTGDLAALVARLRAERPGRAILLAGFSLGGNVVAKYLAEGGDALPPEVRAGAVISVPFDLARCAAAIDAPGAMQRIYRERFLRMLRAKAAEKARRFPGAADWDAVRRARTFSEFDGRLTAPLHGFASAADYWARSSSGPLLAGVRRPLLALSSIDDPIAPGACLPLAAARANPAVSLRVLPAGGHVGFVGGSPWRPAFWAEAEAARWLAAQAGTPESH
ncbi:YheT family hydrolase [Anaeromyxobacter paludicola]|uniref:AB hydrolase-1 domain-containing protein n=1 Tax=Anaeromyxobacter paludicola TaxID=2918171 RepID=A0ABN6N6Z4_9BACT|nr:alpha/beta fold hydrolase [Anaeromyxobacter paludicola]BDG07923.1 hypothetical protein AMPC_10360 [Anaeromyxobacter paludicola]